MTKCTVSVQLGELFKKLYPDPLGRIPRPQKSDAVKTYRQMDRSSKLLTFANVAKFQIPLYVVQPAS